MSFKQIVILLICVVLVACGSEPDSIENSPVQDDAIKELISEIPEKEDQWTPTFEVLPSCKTAISDPDFENFYYQLIRSCLDYDSLGIIDAIHDSVKFSQYECWDDHWIVPEDCENCIRCTKKGIIKGVFGNMNKKQMADRLFHLLTFYGVGNFSKEDHYMGQLAEKEAYANFNFKDDKVQKGYFNYEYILPKRRAIAIRAKRDIEAKRIGELPFEAIEYNNEVGMGEYVQDKPDYRWLPFKDGYIIADDVTSGFDYTLILFEKTYQGWKITGFFEPPGC